jgi:hypothetical protein
MRQNEVWADMARRKLTFHPDLDWRHIKLWGLFSWGAVSPLIKDGKLLTDMGRENKIVWVRPTEETYRKHIEPLLSKPLHELEKLSGWA